MKQFIYFKSMIRQSAAHGGLWRFAWPQWGWAFSQLLPHRVEA